MLVGDKFEITTKMRFQDVEYGLLLLSTKYVSQFSKNQKGLQSLPVFWPKIFKEVTFRL